MKFLYFLGLFILITIGLTAQTTTNTKSTTATKSTSTKTASKKTPVKGKGSKNKKKSSKPKKINTSGEVEFEEVICYEDGPCTFTIVKKDTLVYEVNTAGKQYTLYVIPNKFDGAAIADYNWKTAGTDVSAGHVVINSQALNTGRKYLLNVPAGELKLSDASTLWLSNVNFKEIAKGETKLALDSDPSETFKSLAADAVSEEINYKGKPLNIEGFAFQNKPEGEAGRKEIWVMNISDNLLVIKADNGNMSMRLKEVRERKQ